MSRNGVEQAHDGGYRPEYAAGDRPHDEVRTMLGDRRSTITANENAARISVKALSVSVFVRRVTTGTTPFRWEVYGEMAEPIYVSPERYRSMEAAYTAGRARLTEFVPKKRSPPPGEWSPSRRIGLDVDDAHVQSQDSYAIAAE
jgi:hypothetical protein